MTVSRFPGGPRWRSPGPGGRIATVVLVALCVFLHQHFGPAAAKGPALAVGADRIRVASAAPDGSAVTVCTYRPKKLAAHSPIVVVMHGVKRNAEDYRDAWIDAAEEHGSLIAAPEMSQR